MRVRCLVLFGAGASCTGPGIIPQSPPLGADLYSALRSAFPLTWGALSDELQADFREHFETGMYALWSKYTNAFSPELPGAPSPHRLMQDLGRYFLKFEIAPGQRDLYSQFIMELLASPAGLGTLLSTLNYEHLLEQAMAWLRLRPRVLRPHGGCQLWPSEGGRIFGRDGWAFGQGLRSISSRIRYRHPTWVRAQLDVWQQGQYPCMAIYMPGKVTQIAQRYLWRAQDRFRRRALECDTLVLIGARPWAADTHLWRAIFQTDAKVLFVGGKEDFSALAQRRSAKVTVFIASRFDQAIGGIVSEM